VKLSKTQASRRLIRRRVATDANEEMSTPRTPKMPHGKNPSKQIHKSPIKSSVFKRALSQIASLGLTWTSDFPPRLRVASGKEVNDSELEGLATTYPQLPVEVAAIVQFVVTGAVPDSSLVGTDTERDKKAEIVKSLIATPEYRSGFFFKNSIKLHKLCNLDWEIVIKAAEMGVVSIPACSYAIFSLTLHKTENDEHKDITFATDLNGIRRLKRALSEIEARFETAIQLSEKVAEGGT